MKIHQCIQKEVNKMALVYHNHQHATQCAFLLGCSARFNSTRYSGATLVFHYTMVHNEVVCLASTQLCSSLINVCFVLLAHFSTESQHKLYYKSFTTIFALLDFHRRVWGFGVDPQTKMVIIAILYTLRLTQPTEAFSSSLVANIRNSANSITSGHPFLSFVFIC